MVNQLSKQSVFAACSAFFIGAVLGRISAGWDSAEVGVWGSKECGAVKASVFTGGEEIAINHPTDTAQGPIKKRVLVGKGVIPNLAHFSTVTIRPGQSFPSHAHKVGFHEVFFVTGGAGSITTDGQTHALQAGSLIHVPPGVEHNGGVDKSHTSPMAMAYFGVFGCGYTDVKL